MRNLTGKLVWITGGGSGIGAAAARRLWQAGCKVVISGRRADPLEAMADEMGCAIEVVDVADPAQVAEVGARIARDHGTVDILVNNAGINVPKRHWPEISHTDWEAVVQINVNGLFYCTQAVLPAMRSRGEGLIINISSWAGVRPSFLAGPAYSAAKHAVTALTESLNMEEGVNGVRACAICPGEVSTDIMDKRPVPIPADVRARMIQSEDMGDAVHFVAALPDHVCLNQMIISPTANRGYAKFHSGTGLE